jgi:glycosyltransferase involved in cell wall biosynthesis
MEALVTEIDAHDHIDVVIASQIDCAPYALLLEHTPRVFEEIEVAAAYEQFARQLALFSRVRYGLTWWKLSRFVARLLRDFQGATVVSERERELVEKIMPGYERVAVVPNGVDLEAYTGNFGPPAPGTLVYTGALTYSANLDAMEFFLCQVFPLVKAQQPDVRLRITGRHEGVRLDRLPLGSGAELTGYVEDIRPVVAQSWVCVVPLRQGGGTRLKILEAMALGTPVVSTSKGAEGIGITPGEDILIADEPAEFAAAVLRLLSDRKLRDRLVSNGRRLVQARYGWDRIGETLGRFLDQVVQDKRYPGAI